MRERPASAGRNYRQAGRQARRCIQDVYIEYRFGAQTHEGPAAPCSPPPARRGRAPAGAVVRHATLGHLEPLQRSLPDLSPLRRLGVVRASLRGHPVPPPSAPGAGALGEGGREEGEGGRERKRGRSTRNVGKAEEGERRGRRGNKERKLRRKVNNNDAALAFLAKSRQDSSLDFSPPHARHLAAAADRSLAGSSPLFLNKHHASETIYRHR